MDSLNPVAAVALQKAGLAHAGSQDWAPQKRTRRQVAPERRDGAGARVASGGGGGGQPRASQGPGRGLFVGDVNRLPHCARFFRLTISSLTYTL